MNFGSYRFSPPWWGVLLFGIGAAIFCSLGVWQIERAHYKQGRVAAQQAAQAVGLTRMAPDEAASSGNARGAGFVYGHRYFATGRFDPDHQILLSDQLRGPQTGYRVWTPLILDNGIRVMVDRGWMPKPSADKPLPDLGAPLGKIRVQGFWRSFPQPPLQWGASSSCDDKVWPRVLSYPDAASVRCQYAGPVLNGLLLLDPKQPNGFVRDWDEETDTVGLSPFGHYAYASQWFLMALVAGVIFVVVNLSKRD